MKVIQISSNGDHIAEYGYEIIIDPETGVNYFKVGSNFCPRYKSDGSLVTTSKKQISKLKNGFSNNNMGTYI